MLDNVAQCLCIVRFNVNTVVSRFTQSEGTERLGKVTTTKSSNSKKLCKVVIASESTKKLSFVMITQSENTEKHGELMFIQTGDIEMLAEMMTAQSMNSKNLKGVVNKYSKDMEKPVKIMITQSEEIKNLGEIMTAQSQATVDMVNTKNLGVVVFTQAEDLKDIIGLMMQSGDGMKLNEVMPVARLSFENMCFRFTLIGSIVPCTIVLSNYFKSDNIHINLAVKHDLDDKVIILSVMCVRRDYRVDDRGSMINRGSLIVNSADVAFTTSARSKTDDFLLFYKGFFGVQKYFTRSHIFLKDVFLPVVSYHSHAHFVAVWIGHKNLVAMLKGINDLAMLTGSNNPVAMLRDLNDLAMLTGRKDPVDMLTGRIDQFIMLRDLNEFDMMTDRTDLFNTLTDLMVALPGHRELCTKSGQNDKIRDQVSPIPDSSKFGISDCRDFMSLSAAHSNRVTSMFTHLHLLQIKHLRRNGSRTVLDNPLPVSLGKIQPADHPKVSDTSTFHHTFVR